MWKVSLAKAGQKLNVKKMEFIITDEDVEPIIAVNGDAIRQANKFRYLRGILRWIYRYGSTRKTRTCVEQKEGIDRYPVLQKKLLLATSQSSGKETEHGRDAHV
ncbi:hypothetical protein Y032_0057g2783 [Ancylostoma ceylanicum]|uniref:Reverse transcriptase domain-containing protein n=1 Tax=Ancylostoma ceylanicum TaxID=53326 RepID=A0A016U4R8_9BILA|nr:hypothetical protein Y032_0057g2783 [Ancylostoma ceylanicum]